MEYLIGGAIGFVLGATAGVWVTVSEPIDELAVEDRGQGFYPGAEDTELMASTTLSDVQKERRGQLRLMGDGR